MTANYPSISGLTSATEARLMLYQSGRLVHAPTDKVGLQLLDPTLTALAALNATPGLVVQTGADTFTKRTLVAPAAGLAITNPAGTAGNPTFALANDLAALEGVSGTGIARRTGTDTWSLIAYEEAGTFSPRIDGSTTAGAGTYTTQAGDYTRVGDRCYFTATVIWTAHTGTGNIVLANLPFTATATSTVALEWSNLTYTNNPFATVVSTTATALIRQAASGGAVAGVPIDTNAMIRASGHYRI